MTKSNTPTPSRRNKKPEIYMDYAASASPNPSSLHALGLAAMKDLKGARDRVAQVIGARPEEIIFTASGTESNNLSLQGIVYAWHEQKKGSMPHIITTNIEHPSVLETCKLLVRRKLAEISIVSVEPKGIVDPKKIKKEITKNTVLVSVVYANNEIGTIQNIREIGKEIRHYKKMHKKDDIFLHTDAVQAVNYLDLNVEKLGIDMLTLSGTKIEGSGRVGILYKKKMIKLAPLYGGGDQEMGLRPGTENVSEIVRFSKALERVQSLREKESARVIKLRDYFIEKLVTIFPQEAFIINGDIGDRLPNNINVTFSKIPSDLLVIELSARGIMVSSKSACKSSRAEGSYVIHALRPDADPEIGGLRFSFGRDTKREDINYVIKSLKEILAKLKKWY